MVSNLVRRWPVFLLLILLLWGAAVWTSHRIEGRKPGEWSEAKFVYLPEGPLLKPLLVGHDQAFASLLWVEGVLYFADAYLEGKSYLWLGKILSIIQELDPKFETLYHRGAMMLPGDIPSQKTALSLYQKGIREFPHNYKIRFYAAMAQLAVDSNYMAAAEYLKPVLRDNKAPEYIRNLSTTILNRGQYNEEWVEFMLQEYLMEMNPLQKQKISARITQMLTKNQANVQTEISENLISLLEQDPALYPLVKKTLLELISGTLTESSEKLLELLRRPQGHVP